MMRFGIEIAGFVLLGFVVLYGRTQIARPLDVWLGRQRAGWYTTVMIGLYGIECAAGLTGIILLIQIADGVVDPGYAFAALLIATPALWDIYRGLRWNVWGRRRSATWQEQIVGDARAHHAVAVLEAAGFMVEPVTAQSYAIWHRDHPIPALHGRRSVTEVIAAADRLYPILLHGALVDVTPTQAAALIRAANTINAN